MNTPIRRTDMAGHAPMETLDANLYDFPRYYDLVFGSDWKAEFDFLKACFPKHARGTVRRVFEGLLQFLPIHLDPLAAQRDESVGPVEQFGPFVGRQRFLAQTQLDSKIEQRLDPDPRLSLIADLDLNPWSRTLTRTRPSIRSPESSTTPPAGENLAPLEMRLVRTCVSRS